MDNFLTSDYKIKFLVTLFDERYKEDSYADWFFTEPGVWSPSDGF